MKLRRTNTWCFCTELTDKEQNFLEKALKFFDQKAVYSWKFKAKQWDGYYKLFYRRDKSFPAGLFEYVKILCQKNNIEFVATDERNQEFEITDKDISWLRDYQKEAYEEILKHKNGIIQAATGCHIAGQKILMFDGSFKNVENIVVGDQLMGTDGFPRNVLSLLRGQGDLVKIVPKRYGDPFIVNMDHILSLEKTQRRKGDKSCIIDVSIRDYLKWSKTQKHLYKLYRRPANFKKNNQKLPLDPYFFGLLLGDGSFRSSPINLTTLDKELANEVYNQAQKWGLKVYLRKDEIRCPSYFLSNGRTGGKPNVITNKIRELGLWEKYSHEKFIPNIYKITSKKNRLNLLAGLIDTDGHLGFARRNYFEYCTTSQILANDVAFLARSLGFAVHIGKCGPDHYAFRLNISGEISKIPTRLPRKRAYKRRQKKNVLRTGFSLEFGYYGNYYGFELDGDKRYYLEDFTITHNSGKTNCAIALANKVPINWLFIAHKKDLLNQTIERFERYSTEKAGKIGDGIWNEQRFTVATFQSIHSAIKSKNEEKRNKVINFIEKIQGIIIDECHTTSSSTFWQVAMLFENALYRIGLSATPLSKQNKDNIYTMSALGPVRHKITSKQLIEREILAKPKIIIHEIEKEFSDFENIKKHKWKQVYDDYIISFEERNKKIVEIVKSAEKPCLVFVSLKKHGQMLEQMINSSGLKSRFVWGEKSTEEREVAIKDLVSGNLDTLVVSVIFNEGIDIPELKSVVLASAGKSIIQVLQKIGRGMRRTENKHTFQVFDLYDISHPWISNQAKNREKIFKKEGFEVLRVCPT